ncbi:MAG TPA: FAD-dependent oxidoreductase [Povalibacter sp.]|nr:FAD-dependent oxidoreductase [Povalibacter sp.]
MNGCDFLIVGGGIAGASLGFRLSEHGKVTILEAEAQPGYHSSGRSATHFNISLGKRAARVLTHLSRSFFLDPPPGFAEHPLWGARATLTVANAERVPQLRRQHDELRDLLPETQWLGGTEILSVLPIARIAPDAIEAAVLDRTSFHLDGHGLLQGYLSFVRRRGGQLVTQAPSEEIAFRGGRWQVRAKGQTFSAPILVNASGAWADKVAALAGVEPIGLQPLRRTVVTISAPAGANWSQFPFVRSIGDDFYFAPEGPGLLISPADETPMPPGDVQPDDLDVAVAIDRFEQATTQRVERPRRSWSGLRSFVADRVPVAGFDPQAPGFFWLAGQGGVGLQTSPALSATAASLLLHGSVPDEVTSAGLSAQDLGPQRLR